ncbi:MAG TPA: LysE family translocator [Kiloniellaceae bacterium]|nr:LysE family translocator [Kiloniellaceae bacterium]
MDPFALAIFAAALVLAAGTPGPSIAALVSRVIASGWRDVLPFLAAMWIGEVIWLSMALAGLSALAETFQLGFQVLKWLGVAYLCWLAWKMWQQPAAQDAEALPSRRAAWPMFATGMAVTLGNPKIMVFYLALLPSLIDLSAVDAGQWILLAAVTLVCLASVDLLWVALAHHARRFLRTPRATRIANRLSALAFGGAAAAIAARS